VGIPQSYSRELPERCLRLIEALLPVAERVHLPAQAHLGPLTTTFLLAMATPMILLPLERVKRHREEAAGAYLNERPLDQSLAAAVDGALGSRSLRLSPFFTSGQWRFAAMPYSGENVADHFPDQLEQALCGDAALDAAANMPAEQWSSCLRNSLAHGGIMYLDEEGRQTYGGRATMLVFISARYPRRAGTQPPDQLRAMRIAEADFLMFLHNWTNWISAVGLSQALAA
jgi:hypothetical protein